MVTVLAGHLFLTARLLSPKGSTVCISTCANRSPLYNSQFFWVPRVTTIDRFHCNGCFVPALGVSRLAELREALGGVEGEREGLLVKVGGLEGELGAVQGEREGLLERVGLLEGQLREAQATLDTRE